MGQRLGGGCPRGRRDAVHLGAGSSGSRTKKEGSGTFLLVPSPRLTMPSPPLGLGRSGGGIPPGVVSLHRQVRAHRGAASGQEGRERTHQPSSSPWHSHLPLFFMPRGSYRKERLGRRRRDGRRSLAAATTGPEAGAHWLGLRGADDSGLGKRGQRGLNRGCFLGSALQALGPLQVPSSLASKKGPGPAALSPTSLLGAGRGPGREAVQKKHSPGVGGLDPSLISALTASPRASHTSP